MPIMEMPQPIRIDADKKFDADETSMVIIS